MPPYDMESSSGLIMRVIRILTDSKDDAERDVIRKNLEDCLADSDQKLTKLVSDHHQNLRLVMQIFTKTSNNLESALMKLESIKQRLEVSRKSNCEELQRIAKSYEELLKSSNKHDMDERENDRIEEKSHISDTTRADHQNDIDSTMTVFTPRTSDAPALFKFSRSSYAICFRPNNNSTTSY